MYNSKKVGVEARLAGFAIGPWRWAFTSRAIRVALLLPSFICRICFDNTFILPVIVLCPPDEDMCKGRPVVAGGRSRWRGVGGVIMAVPSRRFAAFSVLFPSSVHSFQILQLKNQ